jgi:O-antigen ligase
MPPPVAAFLFAIGIWWLFALDRQSKGEVSKSIWLPVIWLLIAGSRNPGEWLHMQGPASGARYLDGNPLDRAILATLMAMGLFVLLRRQRQTIALLRTNAPILLYFAYCAVSSAWSEYPDVAFKRWFRGFGDVIMVLVILTEPDWVDGLKRVFARVAYLLLPLSVLLIRYFPALGRGYSISGEGTFWTGVATDKNGLGMICLVFGLGVVWRFIDTYRSQDNPRRKKQLLVGWILIATTLYLLWESNSMTSIACFAMAGGLMIAADRWQLARKPAVVTMLVATAVAFSAFVLFGGASSVLALLGRNPTLTGRTEIWSVVLPFARNPLLGTGYESFWLGERLDRIQTQTVYGINEAHNGYLEIYLNLGWIGISFLALVIATGYTKVIRGLKQDTHTGKLRLAYFVVGLIYNFTEAGFKMMNPIWMFFILSIMAISQESVSESAKLDFDPLRASTRQRVPRTLAATYRFAR